MISPTPYAYFWASLSAVIILSAIALVFPSTRKIGFISAALHTPAGIFGFTLDVYFTPPRFGGYESGVEDLLFSFAAGLAVWLLVALRPFARRLTVASEVRPILRRVLVFALVTPIGFFALVPVGVNPMTALMVVLVFCGGLFLVKRPDLWPLAIPATIFYPLVHGAATAFAFWAWPDLPARWNPDDIWGAVTLLGIPRGELAWAVCFGFSWPVIVAFLLNARAQEDHGSGVPT